MADFSLDALVVVRPVLAGGSRRGALVEECRRRQGCFKRQPGSCAICRVRSSISSPPLAPPPSLTYRYSLQPRSLSRARSAVSALRRVLESTAGLHSALAQRSEAAVHSWHLGAAAVWQQCGSSSVAAACEQQRVSSSVAWQQHGRAANTSANTCAHAVLATAVVGRSCAHVVGRSCALCSHFVRVTQHAVNMLMRCDITSVTFQIS